MSKLYVVPTPIGNLKDMTFRAVEILKEVDIIFAEDTRTTGILLKHFDIETKQYSYHKFNEHQKAEQIAESVLTGKTVALVSDAGTPAISDPGWLLVNACIAKGVDVETLPGATAFVPALVNSGLPTDKFCFEGFLPQKKGRMKRIKELQNDSRTLVLYESPYRLVKALRQFSEVFGAERQASVSREISKLYEENVRGTLAELYEVFSRRKKIKGEIVLVIEGNNRSYES
ncbi:MAG: 16S rRNA (cytidine(1402)-2'-O)-methyltransferase [Bacteroidota bacterium]|nr:16S rRNA (cytidine(1402)-2'-O)-methyltransferase [Bacteroidota bacterium]